MTQQADAHQDLADESPRRTMSITVNRRKLQACLDQCNRIADSQISIPVLANVLLHADASVLRLAATDLDVGLTATMPAEVHGPGKIIVNASDLLERVRKLRSRTVDIAVDAAASETPKVTLCASGRQRGYALPANGPEIFPMLPAPEMGATGCLVGAKTLTSLIERTRFADNAQERRDGRSAVLTRFTRRRVEMIRYDGSRLACMAVRPRGLKAERAAFVLPPKAVEELARVCKAGGDGSVRVTLGGTHAFFHLSDRVFSAQLADEEFPMPEHASALRPANAAKTSRAALEDAVRAVLLAVAKEDERAYVTLGRGVVILDTGSEEHGSAHDEVRARCKGRRSSIALNPRHLLQTLKAMDAERVELGVSRSCEFAQLRPCGTRDDFVAVLSAVSSKGNADELSLEPRSTIALGEEQGAGVSLRFLRRRKRRDPTTRENPRLSDSDQAPPSQ